MAIFIQTDSDESMLAAMKEASELEAMKQLGPALISEQVNANLDFLPPGSYEPAAASRAYEQEVLDRLDRGVPPSAHFLKEISATLEDEGAPGLADYVAGTVPINHGVVSHYINPETRCNMMNAVNKFNSGIDLDSISKEKALETVCRQGLEASTLLFAALGHPVEKD